MIESVISKFFLATTMFFLDKTTVIALSSTYFPIISFKEFVGRNPPAEIIVIDKLRPLKSLIPDNENKKKIQKVKNT